MWNSLKTMWIIFLHMFRAPGDDSVSGREARIFRPAGAGASS